MHKKSRIFSFSANWVDDAVDDVVDWTDNAVDDIVSTLDKSIYSVRVSSENGDHILYQLCQKCLDKMKEGN